MYTHESNTRDTDSNAWESVSLRPVEKLGWGKEESRHRDRDMVSMEKRALAWTKGSLGETGQEALGGGGGVGAGRPQIPPGLDNQDSVGGGAGVEA